MKTEEAKQYATEQLKHFIGEDFTDPAIQMDFCEVFREILMYFRDNGLIIVNKGFGGMPVIGCEFDKGNDHPFIVHGMF